MPQPSPGSMAGVRRCAPCASVCAVCAVCVVCAVCAVGCVFCARVWGSGNVVRSQVIRGSGSVVSVTLSLPGGGYMYKSWPVGKRRHGPLAPLVYMYVVRSLSCHTSCKVADAYALADGSTTFHQVLMYKLYAISLIRY